MGTLDYGWIYIERGVGAANGEMQIACQKPPTVSVNWNYPDETTIYVPGGQAPPITLHGIEEIKWTIKLRQLIFKTETDQIACLKNFIKLNYAGTFTIEFAKSAVPAFNNIWSNGTTSYASMEVKVLDLNDLEEVSPNGQGIFICKSVMLFQAG